MEIEIFCEGKISLPYKGIRKSEINGFIEKIAEYLKLKNRSITVIITDNNYIRKLNLKYRKKDYATDVISFNYQDEPFPEENIRNDHLGDIYIYHLKKLLIRPGNTVPLFRMRLKGFLCTAYFI